VSFPFFTYFIYRLFRQQQRQVAFISLLTSTASTHSVRDVSRDLSPNIWTHLFAVALLTAGQVVHADDKPVVPDGDKLVPLKGGGGILVQKEANPYQGVSSSTQPGKYRPDQPNYGATSSFAGKEFSLSSGSGSKSDSAFDFGNMKPVNTKSFEPVSHSAPNQDTKFSTETSSMVGHHTSDLGKSYTTSHADLGQNKTTLLASTTSPDQDRAADMGPGNTKIYPSPMAAKTFEGPEADAVKRDLTKLNNGLMQMKDLPSRPLTIDEVRALINHGVKPNTDAPPEPPTKALNDPGYKPEPTPPPPEAATDDDKDDPVPSPGTMAQPPPENSEPLPQH